MIRRSIPPCSKNVSPAPNPIRAPNNNPKQCSIKHPKHQCLESHHPSLFSHFITVICQYLSLQLKDNQKRERGGGSYCPIGTSFQNLDDHSGTICRENPSPNNLISSKSLTAGGRPTAWLISIHRQHRIATTTCKGASFHIRYLDQLTSFITTSRYSTYRALLEQAHSFSLIEVETYLDLWVEKEDVNGRWCWDAERVQLW